MMCVVQGWSWVGRGGVSDLLIQDISSPQKGMWPPRICPPSLSLWVRPLCTVLSGLLHHVAVLSLFFHSACFLIYFLAYIAS